MRNDHGNLDRLAFWLLLIVAIFSSTAAIVTTPIVLRTVKHAIINTDAPVRSEPAGLTTQAKPMKLTDEEFAWVLNDDEEFALRVLTNVLYDKFLNEDQDMEDSRIKLSCRINGSYSENDWIVRADLAILDRRTTRVLRDYYPSYGKKGAWYSMDRWENDDFWRNPSHDVYMLWAWHNDEPTIQEGELIEFTPCPYIFPTFTEWNEYYDADSPRCYLHVCT